MEATSTCQITNFETINENSLREINGGVIKTIGTATAIATYCKVCLEIGKDIGRAVYHYTNGE